VGALSNSQGRRRVALISPPPALPLRLIVNVPDRLTTPGGSATMGRFCT